MSAPLRFTKEEVLRRELVKVQSAVSNIAGSDTIQFALPEGVGAWDPSSLTVHIEMDLRDSAGARLPQGTYEESRVFAQEMFTSAIFSEIESRINAVTVSDDEGGNRYFPEAYRKMLSRPKGWFASAVRPAISISGAGTLPGTAPADVNTLRVLAPEFAGTEGFAYGEFLDSADTHYVSAANPAVIGVGGPADTRVDARKLARRRYLARDTLAIAWKPDCSLTRIDGLLPGDCKIELLLTKNLNLNHLVQAVTGFVAGPPQVTWRDIYLTITRVIPKSAASPALYRPIVCRTTRHVYNSQVLPMAIGPNASFNLPQLLTGPRPDMVIFALTADAPVVGASFTTRNAATPPADELQYDGRSISLLGSGRGAAVTAAPSAGAGITHYEHRTAPYLSISSFRARWGSEPLPAFGAITQTDATQGAARTYYEMHLLAARRMGGGGLSFGEFVAHQHVVLDMSREISETEEGDSGSLSLEFSVAQSGVLAGHAPPANTFRLHTIGIYHGGSAAIMLGEHSPSASGRREVTRGW
eukprot:m.283792 g.283792  ORF g.283792 m.283792 type:complete len:528 (+) comp11120_c0_seq5:8773-10356(+)